MDIMNLKELNQKNPPLIIFQGPATSQQILDSLSVNEKDA